MFHGAASHASVSEAVSKEDIMGDKRLKLNETQHRNIESIYSNKNV